MQIIQKLFHAVEAEKGTSHGIFFYIYQSCIVEKVTASLLQENMNTLGEKDFQDTCSVCSSLGDRNNSQLRRSICSNLKHER